MISITKQGTIPRETGPALRPPALLVSCYCLVRILDLRTGRNFGKFVNKIIDIQSNLLPTLHNIGRLFLPSDVLKRLEPTQDRDGKWEVFH